MAAMDTTVAAKRQVAWENINRTDRGNILAKPPESELDGDHREA